MKKTLVALAIAAYIIFGANLITASGHAEAINVDYGAVRGMFYGSY